MDKEWTIRDEIEARREVCNFVITTTNIVFSALAGITAGLLIAKHLFN